MGARRVVRVGWLAALSAALLLAACGSDVDQSAGEVQQQPAAAEVSEQAESSEQPRQAAAVQEESTQQQAERQQEVEAPARSDGEDDPDDRGAQEVQDRELVAPLPLDGAYALEMLRAIADGIGSRAHGEPGERETVEFLSETLRVDGYAVAVESFEFSPEQLSYVVTVASSDRDAAPIASFRVGLMRGSPERSASGPLVVVPGYGTEQNFASVDVDGAIAVVARGELTFTEKQRNAEAAGAVALLVYDPNGQFRGALWDDEPGDIPVAALTPDAARLALGNQGATATFGPDASVADQFSESWNVVARRPGGVCRVVVGGHYDTVPNVPGANDNASGMGIMLALARAWADASSADDICFIGFGAEELGLNGSFAFVADSRASGQLSEITAMLNLDAIGNGEHPILAVGDPALAALLIHLGEQLEIDVQSNLEQLAIGSDHVAFRNEGVPVIFPITPGGIMHVPADNVDNIDEVQVRDVGLLAHAMLECLLERAGSLIEPRLSCDAEGQ